VGGRAGAAEAPWYVAAKDARRNALIVVQNSEHPLLMTEDFEVEQMHWLISPPPLDPTVEGAEFACAVKTRYRQSDLACRMRRGAGDRLQVRLRRPARAVTPGQYAVFYADEVCLGGGVIAERKASAAPPGEGIFSYNSCFVMEGS
jgi:tRNA-specific 2-thiouridylase